jgi:hypothetical protein
MRGACNSRLNWSENAYAGVGVIHAFRTHDYIKNRAHTRDTSYYQYLSHTEKLQEKYEENDGG